MVTIKGMMRKLERFQAELEDLSGKTITIIPDKNDMIDRQCPKNECLSFFKVNADDWRSLVKDEEAFCPFCRNKSEAKEYMPIEQRKQIVNNIRKSISDHWKHGIAIAPNISSLESSKEFELDIQCEECNTRFSIIGAAYFCPCCGFNSIEKNARNSIDKILLKTNRISEIKKSLEISFSSDEVSIIVQSMIESSLSDCIGILQAFSEYKYQHLTNSIAPFNAFQNVEKSNKLWIALKGQGYETWLTDEENKELLIFTQRRHLFGHKGGIVDLKYIQITNDNTYQEGARVIVSVNDIKKIGYIIFKLIDAICLL